MRSPMANPWMRLVFSLLLASTLQGVVALIRRELGYHESPNLTLLYATALFALATILIQRQRKA